MGMCWPGSAILASDHRSRQWKAPIWKHASAACADCASFWPDRGREPSVHPYRDRHVTVIMLALASEFDLLLIVTFSTGVQ